MGFFFWLVIEGGRVLDVLVIYFVMYERLKFYFKILGIDEGEMLYSLCVGCVIMLVIGGGKVQVDGIMFYIGWLGIKIVDYYLRVI